MSRKLRANCPGCRAVLQISAAGDPRIDVTCPKCNKHFVVKVSAPRAQRVAANGIASVEDDIWSAALGVPPPAAIPRVNFPTTSQFEYYGARTRSRVNYKVLLWPAVVALGICLSVPLVWFASSAISNLAEGNWSSYTLVSDSPERLINDYLQQVEEGVAWSLATDPSDAHYRDLLLARIKANHRQSEQLLIRAVKLPKASLTLKSEFEAKSKALADKYRDQLIEKAKQNSSGTFELSLNTIQQDQELRDAVAVSSAAAAFILNGLWDVSAPTNDVERIYFNEMEVGREFLKALAKINSKRDAKKAYVEVEKLSDRAFELAVDRAKLPQNVFAHASLRYGNVDRVFATAERALVRRVERRLDVPEDFKDAISDFVFARSCIARAASGTSEPVLRKMLADSRASRAKTLSRPDKELLPTPDTDIAVKSVLPLPTFSTAPRADALPDNEQTFADASTSTSEATQAVDSGQAPLATNQSNSDVDDIPEGHLGRFGARGVPSGSDRSPARSLESYRDSFSGASSVTINISNNQRDASSLVKRLAEQLAIKEYFCQGSDRTAIIGLRFSGPLEEVVSVIDFGDVLSVDNGRRVITVAGSK